ncbi:hypothetical protein DR999_PMT10482 [Platysternon megacephalum]|uniref:Uncharacterized protein n=1 Tax=Platysternon megacephalum TaxID=55544 RepID=A0A4D9E868_9SAUR|nr:hypothetical protein DR999_PMT10482 [Platysternon megacephalum]
MGGAAEPPASGSAKAQGEEGPPQSRLPAGGSSRLPMLLNCSTSLLLYRPESSSVSVLGLNPALGPPLRAPPEPGPEPPPALPPPRAPTQPGPETRPAAPLHGGAGLNKEADAVSLKSIFIAVVERTGVLLPAWPPLVGSQAGRARGPLCPVTMPRMLVFAHCYVSPW